MNRDPFRTRALALTLFTGALLTACGGSSQGPSPSPSPSAGLSIGVGGTALGVAAVKVEVRVSSFYYNGNGTRPEADVQVGDIVEWDWAQDLVQPHNVTFATLPLLLDNLDPKASSPRQLNSGAVWQVRFTRAGKYTYVCTIHQQMTGTVVVS